MHNVLPMCLALAILCYPMLSISMRVSTLMTRVMAACLQQVWTETGVLVASFMQEGLVRPPREWKPEVAPAEALQAAASRTLSVLQGISRGAATAHDDTADTRAKL